MEDVYIKNNIYEIASAAHGDAVRYTNILITNRKLFSSMDDFFTRLLTMASYIGHRFTQFIEGLVFRDLNRRSGNVVVHCTEEHPTSLRHSNSKGFSKGCSSSSKPYVDGTSFTNDETRITDSEEELIIYTSSEIVITNISHAASSFIFYGLSFPITGLRFAWRLATFSWRFSFSYIRCAQVHLYSITSRLQKTLRGSSDDIGWLQHTPGMPPVEDGTARFLELLAEIRKGKHTLPNSFVYLLIPGLFSNHGPLYFVGTKRFFSKMGLACHIAKIHSEASVEHNAWEIKQYIEELYWGSGKPVMLLGHSKGGVDAAAALSMYWTDLKEKVAGLALVQSPYGGTPLASDILRKGQIADKETRRIMELLICKLIKGDIRALEDLTYDKRKEFIMKYKLPDQIPLISFHTETSIAPGVIATMTHIAQAELPWLPLLKFRSEEESDSFLQAGHQVPVVIPLSAAMAVCALHLQLRYGEKSDGLVTSRDAEVPGSIVVRPDRKLDHAWMVYSSKKNPSEADACEMCEALLTLLVEIGRVMQERKEKSREVFLT
ncbi:uncharacterized protein LOC107431882 isoform X2 [Ziziphus jujuba]|nr:uncharacterized protein LOC107431882 isoform X2 [Ziziphus jujuba]XP_024935425.2 uncharacterized protein LOC107431882 isoform X2 [Ziziphus jujuba]